MEGEAGGASGTTEPHTTEEDPPIGTMEDQVDSKETKTNLKSHASMDRDDILRALEVVEKDSTAIAESFASLFSSLRLALSQASSTSVEHMQCFSDIAGSLQESVLEAANKGNRYINSCLRLNEELKGMESLAMQLLLSALGLAFLCLTSSVSEVHVEVLHGSGTISCWIVKVMMGKK